MTQPCMTWLSDDSLASGGGQGGSAPLRVGVTQPYVVFVLFMFLTILLRHVGTKLVQFEV